LAILTGEWESGVTQFTKPASGEPCPGV